MIKIGILGIAIVCLALPLKNMKEEYSLYLSIGGCILIFYYIVKQIEQMIPTLEHIGSYLPIDSQYISIMKKIIGITYIAEFSADICKDAGYGVIAGQISMAGKLIILSISMPIITSLIELIGGLW
ncbi:MAG: stage III sporulation protein AD [Lachnospiraceae bacterium]|nr:stage III sporulation protein AD [Lachnospiraceae bacterium]